MDQLFINLEKRNSVSGEDSYLHIISEEGDKIITAANLARGLFNVLTGGEPEAHNQIYRGGKILTDFYSYDEIIEMVQARDFSDIFVGDIIERDTPAISVTNFAAKAKTQYVVLGINSLNNHGDTPKLQNRPHLVMMPLDGLGSAYMNATNITTGGYRDSYMNKTVIPAVVTALESAFGASHVLQTREYITNTVTTTVASRGGLGWQGGSTAGEWSNQKAILMTELEAYGATPFSSSAYDNIGLDQQLPGMKIDKIMNRRFSRWLRSVCDSTYFCYVNAYGDPLYGSASSVYVVCPPLRNRIITAPCGP